MWRKRYSKIVKVAQWCPILCDMDCIVPGILQAKILEWVAFPFSRRSSQPRARTQVSNTTDGFFTSWATGKPKNTGVGSLSLLQWIFQTQELNQGLLYCRWILYQSSYQGSHLIQRQVISKACALGHFVTLSLCLREPHRSPWHLFLAWHWPGKLTFLNLSSD